MATDASDALTGFPVVETNLRVRPSLEEDANCDAARHFDSGLTCHDFSPLREGDANCDGSLMHHHPHRT